MSREDYNYLKAVMDKLDKKQSGGMKPELYPEKQKVIDKK